MRTTSLIALLALTFGIPLALSHDGKKVQSLSQAVERLLPADFSSLQGELPWQAVEESVFSGVKLLRELRLASVAGGEATSTVQVGSFTVQGDWGPIRAVAAARDGKVLGLEIVMFTEHSGDGVTRKVFRRQFQGLELSEVKSASLKPLPGEPKTVEALRAGLMGMAHALAERQATTQPAGGEHGAPGHHKDHDDDHDHNDDDHGDHGDGHDHH